MSRGVVIATPPLSLNVTGVSLEDEAGCSISSCVSHRAPVLFFSLSFCLKNTESCRAHIWLCEDRFDRRLDSSGESVAHLHALARLRAQLKLSLRIHIRLPTMSWLFLDWFVPLYLLVSVLVLAGFGACLYFLEPGLHDTHTWSNKSNRHRPLVASVNCHGDDTDALI
ncbi:uncharacterized protein smim45 [Stigmatopora nigra]